jgi:hypothetical protein
VKRWPPPDEWTINGVTLKLTCAACPEQYDAFKGGRQIGYLRLRHGSFTVEHPAVGGRVVLEGTPEGDGIFEHHEREMWLTRAVEALLRADVE